MAKNIDIPDGWEVRKLGEVCNIHDGIHSTPKYTSSGVKFISVEDIADYTKTNKYISKNDFEKFFKYKPKINDIFLTRIGSIGTPALIYTDEDIAYYVTISLLHNIIKQVESKFLYYLIQGNEFQQEIYKRTLHVAFPKKINLNEIGECKILLPPLDEQKKIADILSLWDKAIQQTKDLIAYKETQKKGLMQNLLTGKKRLNGFNEKWKTYTLKEVGQIITGKTPNTNKEEYYGKDILFITPTDINNKYTTKTERSLTNIGVKYSKFIPKNSVLVTCIASIGKNTINQEDCTINQQINAIIPNDSNYYEYLYYHLTFNTPYILTFAGKSATAIINKSTFEEIDITIPPLDEQKAIADILSKADEEINLLNKQLDLYTEQKKGLMQNLLTGKVRV